MSQAFSAWYFSWTSGDPHRSGFKFHTAVLSVLMCDVPSRAVFRSESTDCFPGTASKFFFRLIIIIIIIGFKAKSSNIKFTFKMLMFNNITNSVIQIHC